MNEPVFRMYEIMNEIDKINIDKIIEWLDNQTCLYLAVRHDKDKTRPHYHIFVKGNPRHLSDIAKQCDIESQYINKISSWKNALAYAFHLTENAKEKFQYDKECIIKSRGIDIQNIFDTADLYEYDKLHDKQVSQMIIEYGECKISKKELFEELTAKDFHKQNKLYNDMVKYRQMKVSDRQMKVIYITGQSGSGKTTLAKYFAKVMGYDYFVSGSGKDILDGYDKEECIILDDFRADSFTKAELFKLTDNNTNSSVKSRYNNKDISSCKLMIITSIKTPLELYNWYDSDNEPLTQFIRRLGYEFIYIANDNQILMKRFTQDGNGKIEKSELFPFSMIEVYKVLNIEKSTYDKAFWDNVYNMARTYNKNPK